MYPNQLTRRRSSTQKISSRKASFGDGWVWAIDPHEGGKRREGGNEGDDSPPSAIPAGAPTDRSPGYTDRVRQILDNAHDKELTP
ncbi:MAG: hypothetical protein JOZ23_04615 [Mycobacterium sp.]|nr:hypothetical protein [Mycobacterium sp.]